jgi:nucleotide-binding universal stress UspA family protein
MHPSLRRAGGRPLPARPFRRGRFADRRRAPVIVAGFDGTPEAHAALAVAAQRAGPDGTVVAVHVIDEPNAGLGEPYYGRAAERAQLEGRAVLAQLPATGKARIDATLVPGTPAEVLARVARVRDAREIIVGARPLGRLRAALGSVSQRLAAVADRPVLRVSAPRR